MRELEINIRKNQFDYKQVAATEKAYIYSQSFKGTDKVLAYEVFERRENKPYTIAGNEISAAVAFPHNEAFGQWAFVYTSFEKAQVKFSELNAKVKKTDV